MGVVHEGVDRRLDRRVAVKVVPVAAAEPKARDRFVREARSGAGLFHPNAVAVFDAGEADGFLYIVMELIEGRSLADVLKDEGPFEPARAAAIASSVLAALGQAHAAGIVHRDVKPSNVILSGDGNVKLLDFGIARRLDDIAGSATAGDEVLGTPKYVAPEQILGRPATPATDLYAVGVVLFEMLAGTAPFHGDTPAATALARVNVPVPDVRSLRHDVPDQLASAIRTAMAKEPDDRFASAAAMQAALIGNTAPAADDTLIATPEPTQVMPAGGYRNRKLPASWLAGVVALAIAAGALIWNVTKDEESPASASPTTSTVATTTAPTTIEGVIAALQANSDAYGQRSPEIVAELVMIQQDDDPSARATALLDTVTAWVDSGEATPAALSLLQPVLSPLIATPVADDEEGDGNGNGNGGGNGNGNGNGNGGGNGNGNGNGKNG